MVRRSWVAKLCQRHHRGLPNVGLGIDEHRDERIGDVVLASNAQRSRCRRSNVRIGAAQHPHELSRRWSKSFDGRRVVVHLIERVGGGTAHTNVGILRGLDQAWDAIGRACFPESQGDH